MSRFAVILATTMIFTISLAQRLYAAPIELSYFPSSQLETHSSQAIKITLDVKQDYSMFEKKVITYHFNSLAWRVVHNVYSLLSDLQLASYMHLSLSAQEFLLFDEFSQSEEYLVLQVPTPFEPYFAPAARSQQL